MLMVNVETLRRVLGLPDTLHIYDARMVDDHLELAVAGTVEEPNYGVIRFNGSRPYLYRLWEGNVWEIVPVGSDDD